jgi:hypothetical protein
MMIKRFFLLISMLLVPFAAAQTPVYAVDVFDKNVCSRPQSSGSTVCQDKAQRDDGNGNTQNPLFGPQGVLTKIINLLSVVVGIAAIIMIIWAGMRMVTSGTNPQDVSNARERIIYAAIALVVAAVAQVLVRYVIGNFNT